MFATRIDRNALKELKHLSVDVEVSVSKLVEEAIKELLKKHRKKAEE